MARHGYSANGLLPLLRSCVTGSTLNHYLPAVHLFLNWISTSISLSQITSISLLDHHLCAYLHHLWESGSGKQAGKNTVHGIMLLFPPARSRLHFSSAALRGWERSAPSVPHPPMSHAVLVVVASALATQHGLATAVGCLLAFDSYLRVSELTNLVREDICLPNDARLGLSSRFDAVALRLRTTKTGRNQWVTVKSPAVQALLLRLYERTGPGSRVFPFSSATFRRRLHRTCHALGLTGYVPHSLRHGGATHDYLGGMNIEDVMMRGRWASVKSARHYVQQGRALLLGKDVPASLVPLSNRLGASLERSILAASSLAARQ
jgi:hypothetical protein